MAVHLSRRASGARLRMMVEGCIRSRLIIIAEKRMRPARLPRTGALVAASVHASFLLFHRPVGNPFQDGLPFGGANARPDGDVPTASHRPRLNSHQGE